MPRTDAQTKTELVVIDPGSELQLAPAGPLPTLVESGDSPAIRVWHDFFEGEIANRNTKRDYEKHVRRFFVWAASLGRRSLAQITTADVGRYIKNIAPEKKSVALKKQCRAALRKFFRLAVERHVCLVNPVDNVKTEKLIQGEGKTRLVGYEIAWQLMQSIDRNTLVGKRDLAALSVFGTTGARDGAVGLLDIDDLIREDNHWYFHFHEKGGKERKIPIAHDTEEYLFDWIEAAGLRHERRRKHPVNGQWVMRPVFRTFVGKTRKIAPYQPEICNPQTGEVTTRENGRMTADLMGRMMKRRLKAAGLPTNLSPHGLRAAFATDLGAQGVDIVDIQNILGHTDIRTTRPYIRTEQKVSRNLVERSRVGRVRRV